MRVMTYKRIKDVREDNDYTQNELADKLNVNRSTYANWENGDKLIPLEILDKISVLFNVPFSYLLNNESIKDKTIKIKKLDYDYLLSKLNTIKKNKKYSYQDIGDAIGVTRGTAYKYYNNIMKIPVDKLILLSEFVDSNIDKLLGKIK